MTPSRLSTRVRSLAFALFAFAAFLPNPAKADQFQLGGKFGVANGAATYSIPIAVPPGTNGMAPSLSIQYGSQSGNSSLGLGWFLGGLPSVTRCPKTVAQDNVYGMVNYDNNDAFCLDGQRLILFSGTYGAEGAQYRTERDNYSEVISHVASGFSGVGPTSFEVHTKSGLRMDFGFAPDTHDRSSAVRVQGIATYRMWNLAETQDTSGNYYVVNYAPDAAGGVGVSYPSSIFYTGGASQAPYNSVQFVYATRPDQVPYYRAGYLTQSNQRLTDIKTCLVTTVPCPANQLVSDYKLAYQTSASTGRSEMTSVTLFDKNGNSLPATTFTWQGRSTPLNPATKMSPTAQGYPSEPFCATGNFSGSGRADLLTANSVYLASEAGQYSLGGASPFGIGGCASSGSISPLITGDWDGDGKTDIAFGNSFYLGSSSGFTHIPQGEIPSAFSSSVPYPVQLYAGDFDGDGRADILAVQCVSNNTNNPYFGCNSQSATVWTSNGQSIGGSYFTKLTTSALSWTPRPSASGGVLEQIQIVLGDWNGDGRTDFAVLDGQTITFYDAPSFNPVASFVYCSGCYAYSYVPVVGDWNGDGKTDIALIPNAPPGSGAAQFYLSTGTGFKQMSFAPSWGALAGGVTSQIPIVPVDFNGDGMMDILYNGTVYISNGSTFTATVSPPSGYTSPIPYVAGPADVNGDGAPDVWIPCGTCSELFDYFPTTFSPDLIKTFTSGLGASTGVKYSPLDRTAIYTKGTGSSYPSQDVQNSMYVVSEVDAPNYSGTSFTSTPIKSTYTYSGLVTELDGRGSLGFTSVTSLQEAFDLAAGASTTTDMLQNQTINNTAWPLTGYPVSVSEYFLPGGVSPQLIKQTTSTYCRSDVSGSGCASEGTGIYQIVPATITTIANELDGTALPTTKTNYCLPTPCSYDPYGNAGTVVTWTLVGGVADGYKKTTTNQYSNDTTNWLIGELTSSIVVGTSPYTSPVTRTTKYYYCATGGNCPTAPGRLYQSIVEPSITALNLTTTYGYDSFGNKTSVNIVAPTVASCTTTLANCTTTTVYDSAGLFPTTVTNALGLSHTYTYDPNFGGMTSDSDPSGIKTSWTYDTFGRKANETRPDGSQTTFTYVGTLNCAPYGCSIDKVSTLGSTTTEPEVTAFYDQLERPEFSWQTSFDGSTNNVQDATTYDALGHTLTVSLPYLESGGAPANKSYLYDPIGRVASETRPDGSILANTYNVTGGNPTTITTLSDPGTGFIAETTQTEKDSQGNLVTSVDALTNSSTFQYDPFGNMTAAIDPATNQASMSYDARGHLRTLTDPDLGAWIYVPDALGELTTQTDAKSQMSTMTYDPLGRMITRVEADLNSSWFYEVPSRTASVTGCIAANSCGKLVKASTTAGYQRIQAYNSLGLPSTTAITIDGTAYTTSVVYDNASRLAWVGYPSGYTVSYRYNANGYLNGAANGGASLWSADTEDAALNLTHQTYGNTVGIKQTFDPLTERLNTITAGTSNSVENLTYVWDGAGNVKSRADGTQALTETFTYDVLNRLRTDNIASGTSKTFAYDTIGNLLCKTDLSNCTHDNPNYSYNFVQPGATKPMPHAVSGITGTVNNGTGTGGTQTNPSYSYDPNGNMTVGGGRALKYTSFNVPSCMVSGASTCTGANTLTFTFDSEHQRIKQVAPEGTTLYINAGGVMTEKYTASGGAVTWRSYIMVGGKMIGVTDQTETGTTWGGTTTWGAFSWTHSTAPTVYYYHDDGLGSIMALTDASGAVYERSGYDAWGKRRYANGTDDTNDTMAPSATTRGYTSQEQLTDVALIHLNGRVYDPQIGKFTSADPKTSRPYGTQGWNRYAYVEDNPLNTIDPTGYEGAETTSQGSCALRCQLDNAQLSTGGAIDTRGATTAGMIALLNQGQGPKGIQDSTQGGNTPTIQQTALGNAAGTTPDGSPNYAGQSNAPSANSGGASDEHGGAGGSEFRSPREKAVDDSPQSVNASSTTSGTTTTITHPDGTVEARTGTPAFRDNNPGNIHPGDFTREHGQIGVDPGTKGVSGPFAVFENSDSGRAALSAMVATPQVGSRTIEQEMMRYASSKGDNPAGYAREIAGKVGVSVTTSISSLSPAQREIVVQAIVTHEGATGTVRFIQP